MLLDVLELSLLFLNDEALHDGVSRTFGLGHPVEEVIAGDGRVIEDGAEDGEVILADGEEQ